MLTGKFDSILIPVSVAAMGCKDIVGVCLSALQQDPVLPLGGCPVGGDWHWQHCSLHRLLCGDGVRMEVHIHQAMYPSPLSILDCSI